jgi:aspartyl-tRNA(Asn)/glutamyl-tRNA(Gln) amidotransferase subunit C
MSDPDQELVLATAALARLDVTDEEAARLGRDFAQILRVFHGLAELDVDGVEPMVGAVALRNVLREDTPRPSLETDRALAPAPAREGDFFGVPKTLETGS